MTLVSKPTGVLLSGLARQVRHMRSVCRSLGTLALATAAYAGAAGSPGIQPSSPAGDGTLRGRVIDDGGRPIAGCRVSIGSFLRGDDGWHLIALPLSTRTSPNGDYEARDVPPGDWYVRVEQDVLGPGALAVDAPDYPVTYFPGVTDAADARPVHLEPGGVATADLTVRRVPALEMALRISPLDAASTTGLELFLDAAEAGRPRAITPRDVEPGGIVRFKRLRPGRYFVWARARTADQVLAAWRAIHIADRSVEIDFPLARAGRISGRVISSDPGAIIGARVVATLVDGERDVDYRDPDSAEVGPDGSFAIEGVFGARRLRMIGLPDGWRVRSVRIGGQDIQGAFPISAGASITGVEITIGP